jgi:hypothetical protein
MPARASIHLLVGVGLLATLPGCWPDYGGCPYGTLPIDGATGVALDAVIELRATELPPDLPSLDGAVGLETADGQEVPVEVEVDGAVVRMVPRRGLAPDTDYQAWGINEASDAHWSGDLPNRWTDLAFSTGGVPAVLSVTRGEEEDVAVMAFTEAVDLESLARALTVPPGVEARVLGHDRRADTLVEVRLDPFPDILRMTLGEGATTPDGRALDPSGGPIRVHRYGHELIAAHRGEVVCD